MLLSFSIFHSFSSVNYKYDLTIIGQLNYSGSLGRLGISIADCLSPYVKINYIRSSGSIKEANLEQLSLGLKNIILNTDNSPGKVTLVTEHLAHKVIRPLYKNIKSKIKIAYSMLESTHIPVDWVQTLNNDFDAVVVPDLFLVDVYKNSGVNIPIFVIPICMYLDDFFKKPIKKVPNSPFTFGTVATFIDRKNNHKLIQAFINEFGNNKNFCLKIHGRYGNNKALKDKVKKLKLMNVKISEKPISQDKYLKFLETIDCYVYISKGEGFSLTPREAMAMGIPCILTDNSAQTTICRTGLVEVVPSFIKQPFYFSGKQCGFVFDCKINDVKKAMRKVYNKYDDYLKKAEISRGWVQAYTFSSLFKIFLNIVKPKRVILGHKDIITQDYLMTKSKLLYYKYTS